MMRILLLGGSSEASQLAGALARYKATAVFSYAGRTSHPIPQPLPTRVGGFGGVAGLIQYLATEGITHIIDATHPFAAGMSCNAVAASEATGIPLLALERPPWEPSPADRWRPVADISAAVGDLPEHPANVFLAIGRQNIAAFADRPQHRYLLRLADAPRPCAELPLAGCQLVISRGPFTVEADVELLRERAIGWVVSKNSGGTQAGAKILAARQLGLPVTMIARPRVPTRHTVSTVGEALRWLGLPNEIATTHRDRLGV